MPATTYSPTLCVGRTLLSAAFDFGVALDFLWAQPTVEKQEQTNTKINFNGCGQECPLHTTRAVTKPNVLRVPTSLTTSLQPLFNELMSETAALAHKYEYRRRLPHYQKAGRAIFVTFRKLIREPLAAGARDLVLRHCRHDDGERYALHAAVVMPDHVHLLLTPTCDPEGWPYSLPVILKLIKGVSARSVNILLGSSGPVWQDESLDHVLRSDESFGEKFEYIRQNPVRAGLVIRAEDYRWLWVAK
jgi:putative transposase